MATNHPRVRRGRTSTELGQERLEHRNLLAVAIDVSGVARTVGDHVLGVNVPAWDYYLSSAPDGSGVTPDARTVQMVQDSGLSMVRLSNGSGADRWHWASRHPDWPIGAGLLANFAAAAGADAIVNINFGTGTPREGAAYVAYLDGSATDTTLLGMDSKGVDWKTVGFWASLRGATPLPTDDGYNHLRAGHPEAFGFHRFEIGNEAYFGAWQNWTTPNAGDYVTFARRFAALARAIDPAIQVGVGVGNPGEWDQAWNVPVLQACSAAGFTPGFLSDHFYVYDGARETLSDSALLHHTVSDASSTMPLHANSPRNWAARAQAYRGLLQQHLGAAAATQVALLCAEFNSDADSANKQSTSLVKGLFLADALGSVLTTEYQGVAYWNLRNNYDTKPTNASLYGWRPGADEGMLGTTGPAPFTGPYVAYPAFFAAQLAAKVARAGGQVVRVSSTNADLAVYAVTQTNGHVALLVINKSATDTITDTFSFSGFVPGGAATLWQYGKAEDTAQQFSVTGAASLTQTSVSIQVATGSFTFSFPSYSMSVLDLAPSTAVVNPAAIFTDAYVNGWNDAGSWLAGRTIDAGVVRLHGTNAWEALQLNAPATITPQAGDRLTFRARGTGTWRVEGEVNGGVNGQDVVLGSSWASFSIPVTALSTAPFTHLYFKNRAAGLDMDLDDVMLERGTGGGTPGSSFPTAPIPYVTGQPFTLVVGGTTHWVYVPQSYDGTHNTPTTLFVWMHGCGGSSSGDVWTVSPGGTAQNWITLAPGGAEGGCWDMATDGPTVLAAIAALKTHFNIKPLGVILGGYSSGGDLGYFLAFSNAAQFAGLLAMNTSPFRDNGVPRSQATQAAWKFNVLHVAHLQDTTYPIAGVRDETNVLKNAGYPLQLVEVDGTHWDAPGAIVNGKAVPGTNADIATYFFPKLNAGWSAPGATAKPPVVSIPAAFTVIEDVATPLVFPGIPFTDSDSPGTKVMTVTLAASAGTLAAASAGGVTVGGTASSRTFTGSLASLNAYFTATPGRIVYLPPLNSTVAQSLRVTIAETDGTLVLSSSATAQVRITPIDDAPTVTAPASFTVTEDTKAYLGWPSSPAGFTDVDSSILTVTLSVPDGVLAASGTAAVTVAGTATQRVFTGSPTSLSAYFRTFGTIAYTPARNNTTARVLTTRVSDGTTARSTTSTIAITPVNDRPTIAAAATVFGPLANGAVEITYDALRVATRAADVETPLPSLVITSIISGSLQRWTGTAWTSISMSLSAPVSQRTILAGQKIRWIPPFGSTALRQAFTLKASDGVASSTTCTVSVQPG